MKISWIKSGDIRKETISNLYVVKIYQLTLHTAKLCMIFCLLILLIIKKIRNYQTSMSNSLDPYLSRRFIGA